MLNYKNKYLKYKNKYLNLKKQIGGNLDNINKLSGPVSVDYYNNDKINKKIIVLGDIHNGMDNICIQDDNTMDIISYYNELYKTDIKIDFFIEQDIPSKESLINPSLLKQVPHINDYISGILDFCIKNYKKNLTKRIHFSDIRGYFKDFNKFVDLDECISFFYFYKSQLVDFHSLLRLLKTKLEESNYESNENIPEQLLKEFRKTNPDIIEKLVPKIIVYINEYINLIDDDKNSEDMNLIKLQNIYNFCSYIISYISDLYVVLRLIKNDDINNIILYVGLAHAKIYYNLFNDLKINLIQHIESENPLYRCIKNIIPFNKFFS